MAPFRVFFSFVSFYSDFDLPQDGFLFLRRILKGSCPAGKLGGGAKRLAEGKVVYFYYSAVNVEVVVVAFQVDCPHPT